MKRIQKSELAAVMPHFFADKDDTSHESEDSPTVSGSSSKLVGFVNDFDID